MIVALALSLAQAEAPPPADVVVVAQRIRRFRARTVRDRRTGVTRCDIRRSSGDAVMDAALCEAALTCQAAASTYQEAQTCMEGRIPAILKQLAPNNPPNEWSVGRSRR